MSLNRKSEIGNRQSGFTLVELLVVISIIAVLIGILVPIVGKVRKNSQEAVTKSLIGQLDAACQAYYTDFNAYPGPLSAFYLAQDGPSPLGDSATAGAQALNEGSTNAGPMGVQAGERRVTGTENLVLGLTGGLASSTLGSYEYVYAKDQLGLGAVRFNPKRPGRANPYMQPTNMSDGKFTDDGVTHYLDNTGKLVEVAGPGSNPSKDTAIPEYIDSFSNPMPILYMRARKGGVAQVPANIGVTDNNVVIDTPFDGTAGTVANVSRAQFNLQEIAPYTQSSIGVGKSISPSDYVNHIGAPLVNFPHGLISIDPTRSMNKKDPTRGRYPYDAYAYLTEPSTNDDNLATNLKYQKHQARKKDQFILISAGIDRVYGTDDDITNFGSVLP